jgi:hypothetical protein
MILYWIAQLRVDLSSQNVDVKIESKILSDDDIWFCPILWWTGVPQIWTNPMDKMLEFLDKRPA